MATPGGPRVPLAGEGKGADIAAWRQAARAEAAAANRQTYGQLLLDMVKAFERVPHWMLVTEGVALGYPLSILRLSIAAYRLNRKVRIGQVVSASVRAVRGITAGSGFATFEMRVIMIRIIDRALTWYPCIEPTLYVDDLSAERSGTMEEVRTSVVGFGAIVCALLSICDMEISKTKSVCTASCNGLGKDIAKGLSRFGIKYEPTVKSLGVGLGAGTRRNSNVQRARLKAFKARLGGFRRLRRARHSTARVLRTGGTAGMTFGQVMGVAPGMLEQQRRATAAADAPATGGGGQNIDLALILADGSNKGRVDPAFQAHTGPIGSWAKAAWNN